MNFKKLIIMSAVGAAIAAGGALASGLASAGSQAKLNRKNRTYQLKMWEATNAYNHPVQQMNRLREAGLNPNLIYGSHQPYNTAQNQNLPDAQPLGDFGISSAANQYASFSNQSDIIQNQTYVANSQVAKNAQDIAESKTRVGATEDELRRKNDLHNYSLDLAKANVLNAQIDNDIKQIQKLQLPEAHKNMLMESAQRVKMLGSQMTTEELKRAQIKLEMDLKKQGLENAPWWSRFIFRLFESNKDIFPKKESFDGIENWKIQPHYY